VSSVARVCLPLATSALLALACAKKEDVVVHAADEGKATTAQAIDADPIALLPPNAVGVVTLDAQALFASQFGTRLLAIVDSRSPLPAAADFEPRRDLSRVHLGFYSMQGADVAGVALGKFKPDAIKSAAEANPRTKSGLPVTRSEYAGRTLYLAKGLGFSVLTERTILIGNETGLRRALDRIQEGRTKRQLPSWMQKTLENTNAPLAGGADFTSQPLSDAARQQLRFMDGMKTMNVVGNFAEPGVNLAGTLTYDEAEAAARGAENLKELHGRLSAYSTVMALIGIPQPVRTLAARAEEKQVKFVAGVDGAALAVLLEKAESYLASLEPAPAPANRAP
jgi:hypothetical protein